MRTALVERSGITHLPRSRHARRHGSRDIVLAATAFAVASPLLDGATLRQLFEPSDGKRHRQRLRMLPRQDE